MEPVAGRQKDAFLRTGSGGESAENQGCGEGSRE